MVARGVRRLSLALQGGEVHGAFTWGVLDRLLQEDGLCFEGLSGTSAGAMNAVVLAWGLAQGGPEGARAALESFWIEVAARAPVRDLGPGLPGGASAALAWTRWLSPQQMNPFDINPLRDILLAQVDFDRLRRSSPLKLFVAATQVNTGRLRVFRTAELTADAVLASACLPRLNRAVNVDGEVYWDGAFAANPAVFPLVHECYTRDIAVVLLSPLELGPTPTSAAAIEQRSLEIAFQSTFLREMRMLAHMRERIERDPFRPGRIESRLLRARFHVIEPQEFTSQLRAESKLLPSRGSVERLKELGRARADAWLRRHRGHIGQRSTVDLAGLFG